VSFFTNDGLFGYNWRYLFTHPSEFPKNWWYHLKWFCQRRIKGYDNRELWSLDYSVARFMLPRLKEFRKRTCGYPAAFSKDYGNGQGEGGWDNVIGEIIWALEYGLDKYEWSKENDQRFEKAMQLFGQYFWALWW